jgi:hypothetical protein
MHPMTRARARAYWSRNSRAGYGPPGWSSTSGLPRPDRRRALLSDDLLRRFGLALASIPYSHEKRATGSRLSPCAARGRRTTSLSLLSAKSQKIVECFQLQRWAATPKKDSLAFGRFFSTQGLAHSTDVAHSSDQGGFDEALR